MDGQETPLQLIGSNYAYWKARTKVYSQAQGDTVWSAIVKGWKHLVQVLEDKTEELAPEETWTKQEIANFKFKNDTLNTVMGSLDES